jgi:glycosyltransferase 2 family protein
VSTPAPDVPRTPPGAARAANGRIERVLRAAVILVPLGVFGNVLLTLVATDRALLRAVAGFPPALLLLAAALALLPWLTGAARILIWARFLGYGVRWRDGLRAVVATDLGAAVSPTAVGGDLFRWGVLVRRGLTPGSAATVTLVSKLEDAVFFALALPFAVIHTQAWRLPVLRLLTRELAHNLSLMLLLGAAIALASWLALRLVYAGGLGGRLRRGGLRFAGLTRRRLRGAWRDARTGFALIARGGGLWFAFSLVLTAIHWTARYSVVTAFAWYLGIPVDPVLFWLLQWVVFTIMTFIPTPGAAGGAEAAFSIVYAPLLPAGVLGLTTAGWRFLTFYLQVGLAALYFGGGSVLARRRDSSRRQQ